MRLSNVIVSVIDRIAAGKEASFKQVSKLRSALCLSLLALLPMVSCAVHEWPEDVPADVVLNIDFDTEMPQYKILDITGTRNSRDERDYILRYTVEAYRCLPDGSFSEQPFARHIFTKSDIDDLNTTVRFSIEEGAYRFHVWTDFVEKAFTADLFYNTENFRRIELASVHEGNNDFRDAFCGNTELAVVRKGSNETSTATVHMGRPLAKFEFITTDLQEFITKTIKEMLRKEALETKTGEDEKDSNNIDGTDDDGETKGDVDTKTPVVDLKKFRVVFIYSGYMPSAFNIMEDKPCDSRPGVTFNSTITTIDNHEASLGFDYVLVNGKESSVMVTIALYDDEGTLLSISPQIEVPIKRSMLTTVRGSFLMQNTGGGVAIDPSFQDEFNVYIP